LAILNLSAIPPFAGFTGKWMALSSLITSKDTLSVIAIIIFLAGSIIALGYYFPLLLKVFSGYTRKSTATETEKGKISLWVGLPLVFLAMSILYISAAPQSLMRITEEASLFLLKAAR
jgi:formate hydrogenlyase subunit 3/multisubunit Na+/H+ antiporter MnhD subunit